MRYEPYPYQRAAEEWIIDHPRCCLFLDMGLGKTVVTLTAVSRLMDCCEVARTLVVAPKRVAETTWSDEAAKWDHLGALRVSRVIGTEPQRSRALDADADVYVIGRDSLAWLVGRLGGESPFDTLVIDELSSFKSTTSIRHKAMRLLSAMASRVVGLTGTPAPNGYLDLFGEFRCVDGGERLGRSKTRYRERYFDSVLHNHIPIRSWLKPGAAEEIRSRVSDITLSMRASDYLSLPDMVVRDVPVTLPPSVMAAYKALERDSVMSLSPGEVTAANAAALMGKLSQFASGAVYDDGHEARPVHACKLERLEELVEAAGSPVLVYYQYTCDRDRVSARLKGYRVRAYDGPDTLRAWNAGEVDVLLAHPASVAYGLNMQAGGHVIVWLSTGWNLELYDQANARLHRQGQACPVTVFRLIARGTVDERALEALEGKSTEQNALMDAMRKLAESYGIL